MLHSSRSLVCTLQKGLKHSGVLTIKRNSTNSSFRVDTRELKKTYDKRGIQGDFLSRLGIVINGSFPNPSIREFQTTKQVNGDHVKHYGKVATEDDIDFPYKDFETDLLYDKSRVFDPSVVLDVKDNRPSILRSSSYGGTCRRIMMHKPHTLNALDLDFARHLNQIIRKYDMTSYFKTILLHTTSSKSVFCSGTDWKTLYTALERGDPRYAPDFFQELYQLAYTTATSQGPFFPVLDGLVIGSGAALFLDSSFPTVTDHTVFAMPETTYGWFPDCGASSVFSRLGPVGKYILLTGRRMRIDDLGFFGLATNHIDIGFIRTIEDYLGQVYDETFERWVSVFGTVINECPKKNISPPFAKHLACIERCFSKESIVEIMAELEADSKLPYWVNPSTDFAKDTLNRLRQKCPLSLAVTNQLLNLATIYPRETVMQIEFRLAMKMIKEPDFHIGMRHFVVGEQDIPNPQWAYPSVERIPVDKMKDLFAKGDDGLNLVASGNSRIDYHAEIRKMMVQQTPHGYEILPNGDLSTARMIQPDPYDPEAKRKRFFEAATKDPTTRMKLRQEVRHGGFDMNKKWLTEADDLRN
eukprot:TRINITY_DN5565_c0_g1_i1.p1 TRINITY_DN5565_c0_g1~~TRINITY_DN5565_c0_g1_i1.p1  ORF type:complete len:583 (+),score=105.12 TRINITY_DN5565_c0_g1_i1:62-1810(+)